MKRVVVCALAFAAALIIPDVAFAAMASAGSAVATAAGVSVAGGAAGAGGLSIDFSGGGLFTDRMMQIIALITILSLAPSILIMMTSFTRSVVVLSLLRPAMGVQQAPPNSVIVSLSLFLTLFVMTPPLTEAYHAGVVPLVNQQVTTEQA